MARELSQDPYVPKTGTLSADATEEEAQQWIQRQQNRLTDGAGFAFAVVDRDQERCAGFVGLWLQDLAAGRAQLGYGIASSFRGHGLASDAVRAATAFGWTIPELYRIELYIEPWNTASIKVAENAGYLREGLLRSHQKDRRGTTRHVAVREIAIVADAAMVLREGPVVRVQVRYRDNLN